MFVAISILTVWTCYSTMPGRHFHPCWMRKLSLVKFSAESHWQGKATIQPILPTTLGAYFHIFLSWAYIIVPQSIPVGNIKENEQMNEKQQTWQLRFGKQPCPSQWKLALHYSWKPGHIGGFPLDADVLLSSRPNCSYNTEGHEHEQQRLSNYALLVVCFNFDLGYIIPKCLLPLGLYKKNPTNHRNGNLEPLKTNLEILNRVYFNWAFWKKKSWRDFPV